MTTCPYWPLPPVWRTYRSSIFSTGIVIVSRYATWGLPTFAATQNSRTMRSTSSVEVQLAHAGDDRLAGLIVGPHLEGGILFGERVERLAQLVLVDLGLRLDGDGDHRLGELHALEHDRVRRVAERVAGGACS